MTTSATERVLAFALAAMAAFAAFGPQVAAPAGYHAFADARPWAGIPNAANVLSNIAFFIAGAVGLWAAHRARANIPDMARAMANLFFVGLLVTAAGSAWYHWAPGETGLAIDRGAMAVAFAGLLGMAAAAHVSARAGAALALAALLAGPWALHSAYGGQLLPWGVLQFGGMALLAALAFVSPLPRAPQVRWLAVLAIYGVAKVFEVADAAVLVATQGVVSGHTVKHLLAAAAAIPVIAAVSRADTAGTATR